MTPITHTSLVMQLAARSAAQPAVHVIEGGSHDDRLARVSALMERAEDNGHSYTISPYMTETGARAFEVIIHAQVQP